ncbi:ChbG/HpnK family deacetylase [Bordetella genomosp. 9]
MAMMSDGPGAERAGVIHIVVCADDFGMNRAINEGIVGLAVAHRLSAVGCLSQAPAFRRDAPRLRDLDVDVGLHLNFTEPLGASGLYMPLPRLIACAYGHLLDTGRLKRQIERQLDAFEFTMGRMPDFIDGHQHVHQLPQIRNALFSVLERRYPDRKPWLRYTAPGRLDGVPKPLRRKAHIIAALGSRAFAREAGRAGLRTNRRFLGVYDFQGGAQAYDDLLKVWLRNACEGDLLMCHPALPAGGGKGMDAQRGAEYQVLSKPGLSEWLMRNGLRIGRYAVAERR